MGINITEVQNITNPEQFVTLANDIVVLPSLIIAYVSFIFLMILAGLIVLKGKLSARFAGLFLLTGILTGGAFLTIYLLPNVIQDVWSFLFS